MDLHEKYAMNCYKDEHFLEKHKRIRLKYDLKEEEFDFNDLNSNLCFDEKKLTQNLDVMLHRNIFCENSISPNTESWFLFRDFNLEKKDIVFPVYNNENQSQLQPGNISKKIQCFNDLCIIGGTGCIFDVGDDSLSSLEVGNNAIVTVSRVWFRNGSINVKSGKLYLVECSIGCPINVEDGELYICNCKMNKIESHLPQSLKSTRSVCVIKQTSINNYTLKCLKNSYVCATNITISNTIEEGIFVDDSNVVLSGSGIMNTKLSSINVKGASHVLIENSEFTNSEKYFIECRGECSCKVVGTSFHGKTDNSFFSTEKAAILLYKIDGGSGFVVENNGFIQINNSRIANITCFSGHIHINDCAIQNYSEPSLCCSGKSNVYIVHTVFEKCNIAVQLTDNVCASVVNSLFSSNNISLIIRCANSFFAECKFINHSGTKPVMYISDKQTRSSFTKCCFAKNTCPLFYCYERSLINLTECSLEHNSGLLFKLDDSRGFLSKCSISDNRFLLFDTSGSSGLAIKSCVITGNTDDIAHIFEKSTLEFDESNISKNKGVIAAHNSSILCKETKFHNSQAFIRMSNKSTLNIIKSLFNNTNNEGIHKDKSSEILHQTA